MVLPAYAVPIPIDSASQQHLALNTSSSDASHISPANRVHDPAESVPPTRIAAPAPGTIDDRDRSLLPFTDTTGKQKAQNTNGRTIKTELEAENQRPAASAQNLGRSTYRFHLLNSPTSARGARKK